MDLHDHFDTVSRALTLPDRQVIAIHVCDENKGMISVFLTANTRVKNTTSTTVLWISRVAAVMSDCAKLAMPSLRFD